MEVKELIEGLGTETFTGVPDSLLKAFCDYVVDHYGISEKHIVAANEGNCVGIAAGRYLATGKVPVVYMQNSGMGNVVNPITSLLNEKVYGIPCVFVIGWRGEPGVHDEPQHVFQGEITLKLLDTLEVPYFVIEEHTTKEELDTVMKSFEEYTKNGKSVAFVIRKGALEYEGNVKYHNQNCIDREWAIEEIVEVAQEDIVVSTTGKASRELFEIREKRNQSHKYDFLTVGSMGHSSSIALGIALEKKKSKIWCIDGDGATLMHMGAMAIIGSNKPENMVHVLINNEAHETVGGMPTVSASINYELIAKGCGYPKIYVVTEKEQLKEVLQLAKESKELVLVEIRCTIGSRKDLGRPTTTAQENKESFMQYLRELA